MTDQLAVFLDFENIAIWAEEHFFDLELNRLMQYLQSRGPVVVKRAYGDWPRFSKYRDDLLENSIDLIQMYSVRPGKNRADIRLALDAFEIATTRPKIRTIVIVSGDSDFGALSSKLREHGMYVLGIGPRQITHSLLVKSCDEFVYLETVLSPESEPLDTQITAWDNARRLLERILHQYGQRGQLPVLGQTLKLTMLSMDPAFNEKNLGYNQFRSWLEANGDLVNLFFKGLEMYVAPISFEIPPEFAAAPKPGLPTGPASYSAPPMEISDSYRRILSRVVAVDPATRRDILRDIYRELDERPNEWTLSTLTSELHARYESKGLDRAKTLVRRIMQLGINQEAYEFQSEAARESQVKLAETMDSQATFVCRIESSFPYELISSGLEIDKAELAAALVNDRTQTVYVEDLLNDLEARDLIQSVGDQYRLPGVGGNPLRDDPNIRALIADLLAVHLPEGLDSDVETARELARRGMAARSHDFVTSAHDYLLACRVLWDAYERADPEASLEDLRWYLASYASVKAGELSQVRKDYQGAQPYYLSFFSLVQQDTPLWYRMRGLINPMLNFYWKNLASEMAVSLPYSTVPAELAKLMATDPNPQIREKWQAATRDLVTINPGVLQRVADQIRLTVEDPDQNAQAAQQIERMLREHR
jgi:hypothetical protein